MDVRMPDGTIITNVPDNITQTELLARYGRMQGMGAAPTGTKNPLMGAVGRTAELAGSGMEAIAEVGKRTARNIGEIFAPENETPKQKKIREEAFQFELAKPLFDWAGSLKGYNKSIGYEPSTKLKDLSDNPLNAVPFIAERVVTSAPDMAAAIVSLPAYIGVRTKEILDERMKNDNKTLDDATVGDVTAATGAAIIEGTLERFATGRLFKGAAAGKTVPGRITKETAIQAGTEGVEETAAYLGEAAGTVKGINQQELIERAIEGAIVGGGLGGGVQATKEVISGRKERAIPEEESKAIVEKPISEQVAIEQQVEQQKGLAAEDEALKALGLAPKEEAPVAPTVAPAPATPQDIVEAIIKPQEVIAPTPAPVSAPTPAPAPLETRAPAPEGFPEVLETRPAPQPELPPTEEIARLREDQQRIADEMKRIEQATEKTRETSLYEFFTFRPKKAKEGETPAPVQDNRLDTKEVFDISPDKTFNLIRKKGGARVSDFISSQQLNEWLPFELRIYGTETAEELAEKEPAAEEYIKESLRNRNYLPYETQIQLQQLGLDLEQVELALEQEMTDEQLRAEANAIAADIAAEEGPVIAGEAPEEGAARGVAERPPEEGGEEITRAAAPGEPQTYFGQRLENAANKFKSTVMENFGLTQDQADRSLNALLKYKVVTLDPVDGQFYVKDGRFMDRDVLLRAAQEGSPEVKKAPSFYLDLLPAAGYKRLPIDDPRTYKNKSDEPFLTFEKDGVRVAFESNAILYVDSRNRVGRYTGNDSSSSKGGDSVFHALIVDPKERKKGKATKTLQEIVRMADESNTNLYMEPVSLDKTGVPTNKLKDFYSRFGFKPQQSPPATDKVMVRKANAVKKRPELDLVSKQEVEKVQRENLELKKIADRERDLFQLQQQIPEREAAQTGDLFGAEGIEQIKPKRPTVATKPVGQLTLFNSDKETIAKPSDGAAPLIDSELKKETDVIEKALKGKTALEAAKWMAANAPRPEYRMIAKRVVDRMEKLMKAGVEFDFKIATIGDRVPIRLLSANGISVSTVDTETNELKKIAIWLNDASNPRLVGTTYDTVMHELIHSVTQGALFLGRRKAFAGTPIADVAKRLQDVREVIVKHYNSRVRDFRTGKGELTDFELRIYNGANYLSDADEVLAWSMTSREMQNYMEAIPYKKTNVWDSFVDAIRQFLGLPKSKETTLSEVLGLTNEIFALPIVERKSILGNPGAPITNNAEAQLTLFARTNIFGNTPPNPTWGRPDDTKTDDIIYVLQDKLIDTKRVISEIEKARGKLKDRWNAYLQEELYHGRTAKQTNDFLQQELSPVLKEMDSKGFTVADVEEYMHNRHAEERNDQIAKVNPAMPDGGSGINTADAKNYLNGLDPKKRADLESIANKIDDMTAKTRKILVQNGLEDPNTIKTWERTYKHYIPLSREEMDYELSNIGRGIGQGFSVRGPTSKRAVGSSRQVVDILANIAMQRERAIVRSEKTRVGQSVYGLAVQHPNTDFWFAVDPDAIKDPASVNQTLTSMGINPADAANIMSEPTRAYIDSDNNLRHGINPALRGAENVLAVRVNGKDKYVFFNTKDPRAIRMVTALKNLDADQLSRAMSMVARATRYFASINTQYNPIFGVINFLRDFQGAALNLSTTPIRGKTRQVMADTLPALRGIYADLRARRAGQTPPTTGWAKLWDEFQKEGGQTGFRDQFSRTEERKEALERELKRIAEGKPKQAVRAVFDWLSDYNETMENAIRLAAYKAGLDKGLTKEQAASVAKNLTVNFNRKGQIGRQVGALYAFFNASVQGTARLYETLKGPLGKQIMFGGLLLGSAQAMLLAAAGFDEDEPPDFIKERNIVIPTGDGKYVTIPMPLGFNVIPNTSRVMTEWAMSGFKDTSKRVAQMTGAFLEMFNPLGNAGWSYQTFSPTVADPIVALAENKDWTGKPIAKKDISDLDPTPGYTRAKDTASWFSKNLAEFLNYATGGTKRRPGVFSPTPDQIDYLIGQATGGVGRELMKAEQTARAAVTGEELPTYKIPLVGRFIGETKEQAAQSAKFYDNIRLLNEHENEIKGRRKDREPVDEYMRENPEARLYGAANNVERTISALRKRKSELIKKNAPKEDIRAIDKRITEIMTRFNDRVRQEKEKGK